MTRKRTRKSPKGPFFHRPWVRKAAMIAGGLMGSAFGPFGAIFGANIGKGITSGKPVEGVTKAVVDHANTGQELMDLIQPGGKRQFQQAIGEQVAGEVDEKTGTKFGSAIMKKTKMRRYR